MANEPVALGVISAVAGYVRAWFAANGFPELRVPTIRPATDLKVRGMNSQVRLEGALVGLSSGELPVNVFRYLAASKRLYVMAPCLRPGNDDNTHLDEYTYIQCFLRGSRDEALALAKSFMTHIFSEAAKSELLDEPRRLVLRGYAEEFASRNFSEVIKEYGCGGDNDLPQQVEFDILKNSGGRPTILLSSPAGFKPNYADVRVAAGVTLDFEIVAPFCGEVAAGGQYETDISRLKSQLASVAAIGPDGTKALSKYIEALGKFSGQELSFFGVGFERLTQCVLGVHNISEAVLFNFCPITRPASFADDPGQGMGK